MAWCRRGFGFLRHSENECVADDLRFGADRVQNSSNESRAIGRGELDLRAVCLEIPPPNAGESQNSR